MENEPFEDVFPIKNGDIPASYVIVYQRVIGVALKTWKAIAEVFSRIDHKFDLMHLGVLRGQWAWDRKIGSRLIQQVLKGGR